MRTFTRTSSLLSLLAIAGCAASAPEASYTNHVTNTATGGGYSGGEAIAAAPSAGGYRSAPAREEATHAMSNAAPMAPSSGYSAPPVATAATVAPTTVPPPPPAAPVPPRNRRSDDAVSVVTLDVGRPAPVIEQQQAYAAVLTAASVSDTDRRANYFEYLSRHSLEAEQLRLNLSRRLRVRVVDGQGNPIRNASVQATIGNARIDGLTHGDGIFDVHPDLFSPGLSGEVAINVHHNNAQGRATGSFAPTGDAQDLVIQLGNSQASPPRVLDLGFVIDVTGSMGDELSYVNREVGSIVQRIRASVPQGLTVRVGATFYRDRTDQQLVQQIGFTEDVQGFANAMHRVVASGGGDYPEDMNAGLDAALHRMQWSSGDATRVLVLIADAPPQAYGDQQFTWREAMREAGSRGIRMLPVAASGADRTVEFLFRSMGVYTSTPYVYLTDDSGVGGAHMEADTDRVAVERFNDLLTRLVVSDLRGEGMHEPGPLAR